MPIEIKELVIRTTIESTGKSESAGSDEDMVELLKNLKEDIITECTYKVFDQLRSNNER